MAYAHMFTNDQVIQYIANGEHKILARLILSVLGSSLNLNQDQLCGAIAAGILINGNCWEAA
jgi:hypothetical protein